MDQKEQPILIYVPKNKQQGFSTIQDLADDYATITYCGHLLNSIADKFSFTEVDTLVHESILFEMETKKLNELAEVTFNISKGFNNIDDGEEDMFVDDMHQYLDDIEKNKLNPVYNYYYQF